MYFDFLAYKGPLNDDALGKTILSRFTVDIGKIKKDNIKIVRSRNSREAMSIAGDARILMGEDFLSFETKVARISSCDGVPRVHFSPLQKTQHKQPKRPVHFYFLVLISPETENDHDWPKEEKLHRLERGCPSFNHVAHPSESAYLTNCNVWIIPAEEIMVNSLDIYLDRFRAPGFACNRYTRFYAEGFDLEACHDLWERVILQRPNFKKPDPTILSQLSLQLV
ncbi:MAG: hypothetical protein ABIR24_03615 [Verrucomicrobiota bacterium]